MMRRRPVGDIARQGYVQDYEPSELSKQRKRRKAICDIESKQAPDSEKYAKTTRKSTCSS